MLQKCNESVHLIKEVLISKLGKAGSCPGRNLMGTLPYGVESLGVHGCRNMGTCYRNMGTCYRNMGTLPRHGYVTATWVHDTVGIWLS